ncbi:hypothetical protein Mgra_00004046 [Meloidogyne graminicola]|uniref:Uncharacterized protein n=1 Tax=Meloidogyne graminicola TaxID=189291 RepID=A0A8S9ZSI9_9BILA|nr:hypothetical protein Mgra_00004046 [Meloidogyne graminicola]
MSGVFKTSSQADQKQQNKLQEIQTRIRIQQSQQQKNSLLPSQFFCSSTPSSSDDSCVQKQQIEFHHLVKNNQQFGKNSEEINSSNKNWAVKTSLLNRLRLKTAATCEGRRNNIGGHNEQLEKNGAKKHSEQKINTNTYIAVIDKETTRVASVPITSTVVVTENQSNFYCSLLTSNSTSNSGALDKQHSLTPSISDNSDDFIEQDLAIKTSASIYEKSTKFCDNKVSDSLSNTLTAPSQRIESKPLQVYSPSNNESSSLDQQSNLIKHSEENKPERQQSFELTSVGQQKSPLTDPFAVPALPASKQKFVSLSVNSLEEPNLFKKEQGESQFGQTLLQSNQIQTSISYSVTTEQLHTNSSEQFQQLTDNQSALDIEEPQHSNIFKTDSSEDLLNNKKEAEKESHRWDINEASEPLEVLKSERLSLRISSAAALQFRRLALNHSKVLNIIGINTVQFNPKNTGIQTSLDCLPPVVQLIGKRAPSLDHISRRRSRLHHLRQQKLLILQHTQQHQQSAATALQQRSLQRRQVPALPQKTATTLTAAAASMSISTRTPKSRSMLEASPNLNSQSYGQKQLNSSSSSSNSTTPQQRTPPSNLPSHFSSPSLTAIFQQQNEHQNSVPNMNSNKTNDSQHLILSSSTQQPQQQKSLTAVPNKAELNNGAAENSPFLVNLLSNKATCSPVLQQPQNSQNISQQNVTHSPQHQQQIMMVKQQQMVAIHNQQQFDPSINGCPPPYQQIHPLNSQFYNGSMNLQQQQLYQQQQHQRPQSMLYGVGPSGMLNNHSQQQHYMIVGSSPPTGPSPSQHNRQAMQCSANGPQPLGGIIASPPVASSSYFGMHPNYIHQNMAAPNSGVSAINTQVTFDESPKKRKRMSKKQQQKEQQLKEEREQQQKHLQEQQAMAAYRHHQQMLYMQQQQQQQRMTTMGAGQQMCGIGMPSNVQESKLQPGQSIASQQHYQQQQQLYQQHYIGLNGQPTIHKQQDAPVMQNNISAPICQHGTPQKNSPMQFAGAQQHQQYVVSVPPGHQQQQPNNYYIMSPQQQHAVWANTPNQMPQCGLQQQTASNEFTACLTNQSQQHHQQIVQSQQAFRTPGTPHYYSQSPASATPFYSPPPSHNQQLQQQQPGAPLSGCIVVPGNRTGLSTPVSNVCGRPTPPHSVRSFENSQQQNSCTPSGSLDTNAEIAKQNSILNSTISSQNHQMVTHLHQSSNEFYQQQTFHHQRQQTMNSLNQQQSSQNFPQFSDFAEGGLGDADDLSVPGILNEGIDDLDLIEPMRYGNEQQQQNHNNLVDQKQQQHIILQQQNDFYKEKQQQQHGQTKQNVQGFKRQILTFGQSGQQCKKQKRKYSIHQMQNGMDDEKKNILIQNDKSHQEMLEMSIEQRNVAEMVLLPDRSPQIGDTPLSPSKLSETQDRNVSDAIASVMERVAKHGQLFVSKTSNF